MEFMGMIRVLVEVERVEGLEIDQRKKLLIVDRHKNECVEWKKN